MQLTHADICASDRVLVGSVDHKVKFMTGSIKEPCFAFLGSLPLIGGRRRTLVDIVGHVAFDLARVWMIASPVPTPVCAVLVFGTQLWMYLFDHGECESDQSGSVSFVRPLSRCAFLSFSLSLSISLANLESRPTVRARVLPPCLCRCWHVRHVPRTVGRFPSRTILQRN